MSDREHAESPATLPGWPTEAPTITPEMAALAAPPEADLATARHLGQRVAEVTLQLAKGKAA